MCYGHVNMQYHQLNAIISCKAEQRNVATAACTSLSACQSVQCRVQVHAHAQRIASANVDHIELLRSFMLDSNVGATCSNDCLLGVRKQSALGWLAVHRKIIMTRCWEPSATCSRRSVSIF